MRSKSEIEMMADKYGRRNTVSAGKEDI